MSVLLTWPALPMPSPHRALELAYLVSGFVLALHYVPLLRRAWQQPAATAQAQPLMTWAVWAVCRVVALAYGIFIVRDALFVIVVGADVVGRLLMALLIVRARAVSARWEALTAGRVKADIVSLRTPRAAAAHTAPARR